MFLKPFSPPNNESFWCNDCDANVIESQNPNTGQVFSVFGEEWYANTQEIGDYKMFVIALCPDCLKKINFNME